MTVTPNLPVQLANVAPATPRERAEHERGVLKSVASLVPVKILDDVYQGAGLPGYAAGDVVGLAQETAERFVAAGLASFDVHAGPRPAARPAEMMNGAPTAAAGGPVRMRLIRPWGSMQPGEVAGFNAALAHELEVKGAARREVAPSLPRRTLQSIRDAIVGRR